MVLLKLLGIALLLFGAWTLKWFPMDTYQWKAMAKTGLLVGLLALVLGIILIIIG